MKSTRFTLIAAVAMSIALAIPARLAAQSNAYSYNVLYKFTGQQDGATPYAGVIRGDSGNLYGTAVRGGDLSCNAPFGCGVVFKIDSVGQQSVLHSFAGGTDGALIDSSGGVVRDQDGNLYGTAPYGGDPDCPVPSGGGCGVVYKIDPQGNYSVIHTFNGADGLTPYQGLLLGSDGYLYGTTFQGGGDGCGGFGCGVVFKMDRHGNETVLYAFQETDGAFPSSGGFLAQDSHGNLYGTTGGGWSPGDQVVFKVDPLTHEYVPLYSFTGGADGGDPASGVILDDAGNAYGSASAGGTSGRGVIFKVDPMGHEMVLYNFTGGADSGLPYGSLIRDAQGNLYGTTFSHSGVIYKLYPGGHLTVLYTFQGSTDGGHPYSGLFRDRNGNLYGTASDGGDLGCGNGHGCGVVFKLSACATALCRGQ
jgi:uncharacterized repeat protein (TIGR03803 family)